MLYFIVGMSDVYVFVSLIAGGWGWLVVVLV